MHALTSSRKKLTHTHHTSDGFPKNISASSVIHHEESGATVSEQMKSVGERSSETSKVYLPLRSCAYSPKHFLFSSVCCTTLHFWWRSKFAILEDFICLHHWKVLSTIVVLALFCFGLKAVTVDTDFDKLWVEESDRLTSEWKYLADALHRAHLESVYADFSRDSRFPRMIFQSQLDSITKDTDSLASSIISGSTSKTESFSNGREFMGTMETILQTSVNTYSSQHSMGRRIMSSSSSSSTTTTDTSSGTTSESASSNRRDSDTKKSLNSKKRKSITSDDLSNGNILTPQALLDHMEFLVKVRRLTITVGTSKWSFKDLCQRATLPFGAEMHHLQAYLDMIIPCIIITPLDCFWEGAKVLGPEEAMWVPWFDERTLLQWTNIDPIGLLQDLQKRYGNYTQAGIGTLIKSFSEAGINHGYLNRTCLDPTDPACPISAPNYGRSPPDVAKTLSGGCPGFAANMLHWPEEIIVGGRVHRRSFEKQPNQTHVNDKPNYLSSGRIRFGTKESKIVSHSTKNHDTNTDHKTNDDDDDDDDTIDTDRTAHQSNSILVSANALQSLILLRSPRDLYEAVRRSDPYKHEGWTLADARHVLGEWRRNLRRLVIEHNTGMQPDNQWHFLAFTNTSLRDLLRDITLRLGPITLTGGVLLVFLYGLVCLLGWRDPVRSQCWLALCGLLIIALASVAGLGICATIGIPFNVLTIQVLPFLLLGLGVESVFLFTTCHECCVTRRVIPFTPSNSNLSAWSSNTSISSLSSTSIQSIHVLSEHGPSLLFSTTAVAGAFFAAAFIPVPLMRQFCLQAGILILVQSASVFILFPVLLQLDETRRAQKRLDVLCCLRQPNVNTSDLNRKTTCPSETCQHHHHRHHHYHRHHRRFPKSMINHHIHSCHYQRSSEHMSEPLDFQNLISKNNVCISPDLNQSHGQTPIKTVPLKPNPTVPVGHPTIQVNVVSHLPGTRKSATSSRIRSTVKTRTDSEAHTVRTTVTVTGRPDNGNNFNQDSGNLDPNSSIKTHCNSQEFNPTISREPNICYIPTTGSGEQQSFTTQNSQHSSCHADSLNNPLPTIPSPILVRLAQRLGRLLTGHWLIQLLVCLVGIGLFCVGGMCATFRLRLGLDWSSLAPTDTMEYGFVKVASETFGLYNFHVITRGSDLPGSRPPPSHASILKSVDSLSIPSESLARSRVSLATVGRGIDFPMQQRRLHWMYDKLSQIDGVMLSGRKIWLRAMRDWLEEVQQAFDADRTRGFISSSGHWSANASELGVLGLRLIVQTDRGPELSRINTGRLVRGGIIDPPAFYTLLRVWRSKDALNYSSLACVIHPEPGMIQLGRLTGPGRPTDLHTFPPADPIEFVQSSFYAIGIREMDAQLNLVRRVRHITEIATAQGVPAFPIGVPFTFAEHYIYLIRETAIAFGIFSAIIFVAGMILFSSPIIVILLLLIGAGGGVCAAIIGLVVLNLDLNPISAGLILISGGLGCRVATGFLGSWPYSHWASKSYYTQHTNTDRKVCLCSTGSSRCSPDSSQYCNSSVQQIGQPPPQSSAINRNPSNLATSTDGDLEHVSFNRPVIGRDSANVTTTTSRCCPIKRRELIRAELVRIMSNQFAPTLHATLGLLLALALLAAARVQFIADYFFRLILFVNFVCFFNGMCLIPTLCFLIGPFHEEFNITSKNLKRNWPKSSNLRLHSFGKPTQYPAANEATPFFAHPRHSLDHDLNDGINDPHSSLSMGSLSSTSSSSSNSSPTSSRSSASSVSSHQPAISADKKSGENSTCSRNTKPSFENDIFKPSKLSDVVSSRTVHSSRRSPNWLDSASDCCSSDAAVMAEAAAAVAAVAAVASVRPRPASLSTISEEPSHSNSTVSLNHITPPNTGSGSNEVSSSAGDSGNGGGHGSLTEIETHYTSAQSPTRRNSNAHVRHEFNLHSLPTNLVSSVDLIRMSRLFGGDLSANALCETLCGSIFPSTTSSRNSSKARSYTSHGSKDLVIDPCTARTILAAVTASGYQAARKRSNYGRSGDIHADLLAPPSYSSVIGESGPGSQNLRRDSRPYSSNNSNVSVSEPVYPVMDDSRSRSSFPGKRSESLNPSGSVTYSTPLHLTSADGSNIPAYSQNRQSTPFISNPLAQFCAEELNSKLCAQNFTHLSPGSSTGPQPPCTPISYSDYVLSQSFKPHASDERKPKRSHKISALSPPTTREDYTCSPTQHSTSNSERRSQQQQQAPDPSTFPDDSPSDPRSNISSTNS